jgi:CrcB protein
MKERRGTNDPIASDIPSSALDSDEVLEHRQGDQTPNGEELRRASTSNSHRTRSVTPPRLTYADDPEEITRVLPSLDRLATVSSIVFFSIWGTLTRLGLSALFTYSGQLFQGVVWAQAWGCFVMGFMAALPVSPKRYAPLYIGLTTGYCGSTTTFSAWILTIFYSLSNINPSFDRSVGHNVLALISQVLATWAVSLVSFDFGGHVSPVFSPLLNRLFKMTTRRKKGMDIALILLGAASWIIAIILTATIASTTYRVVLVSCVFSPIGAVARFYLSRLNSILPGFPLGTFTANMTACTINSIAILILGLHSINTPSCQVLWGLVHGISGCLSTISTFVLEFVLLSERDKSRVLAYTYFFTSLVAGVCINVVIIGSGLWSRGFMPFPNC